MTLFAAAGWIALVAAQTPAPQVTYRYNDSLFHLVNFAQDSVRASDLLKAMDAAGVEHAIVCGLPYTKKWAANEYARPTDTLQDDAPVYFYSATDWIVAEELRKLAPAERRRLHPILCGFNPTDRNAVRHLERMVEAYPNFWQGIGEVMCRHDDLTALARDETPRADHPALQPVYAFAAKHGFAVWIHSNLTAPQRPGAQYLDEVRRAIAANPATKFVWCHAGVAPRTHCPELVTVLEKLLDEYPNVWLDLSWVLLEQEILSRPSAHGAWTKLIERYPTRFIIGTDLAGTLDGYARAISRYEPLLQSLSPKTRERVARSNFWDVLPRGVRP